MLEITGKSISILRTSESEPPIHDVVLLYNSGNRLGKRTTERLRSCMIVSPGNLDPEIGINLGVIDLDGPQLHCPNVTLPSEENSWKLYALGNL